MAQAAFYTQECKAGRGIKQLWFNSYLDKRLTSDLGLTTTSKAYIILWAKCTQDLWFLSFSSSTIIWWQILVMDFGKSKTRYIVSTVNNEPPGRGRLRSWAAKPGMNTEIWHGLGRVEPLPVRNGSARDACAPGSTEQGTEQFLPQACFNTPGH